MPHVNKEEIEAARKMDLNRVGDCTKLKYLQKDSIVITVSVVLESKSFQGARHKPLVFHLWANVAANCDFSISGNVFFSSDKWPMIGYL